MTLRPTTLLRVFIPFALGYFLSYLFRTVNAVIAPDLVRDIGVDPASLGLLTSAYFLAFASFQLPLGVLLDRFGPRRVESALLVFAAVGAFVFARADSLGALICGRALIGLGVSACLMAAFKAFTLWFPADRLPLANGVQMVSGGVGALAATTPVELALTMTDWRGVFEIVAVLTLLAAICVYLLVPEKDDGQTGETWIEQLSGIRTVFTSRFFWSIAPWAFTAQAAYLSIFGLWSGPWLRDVAGYNRMQVANSLMGISLAMIVGYYLFGALAERLARHRGVQPMTVAAWGMIAFLAVQLLLTIQIDALAVPLWLLFGFCGTACILPYAVLSQSFPKHLAGRANTSLNVLVFVSAFIAQWLIGAIIGWWPQTLDGTYHPGGYRAGFALIVACQVLAAGWYLWCRSKSSRRSEADPW
ncbi:MAG: MFS transporter [Deltaproteobacteria bacterium]|jgi:MFS family permease|nr:MFS transporter [Deltaproteobacteria bacterium]MBW2504583.1 MFS transporter [Deltaproteobacteria bacterium]